MPFAAVGAATAVGGLALNVANTMGKKDQTSQQATQPGSDGNYSHIGMDPMMTLQMEGLLPTDQSITDTLGHPASGLDPASLAHNIQWGLDSYEPTINNIHANADNMVAEGGMLEGWGDQLFRKGNDIYGQAQPWFDRSNELYGDAKPWIDRGNEVANQGLDWLGRANTTEDTGTDFMHWGLGQVKDPRLTAGQQAAVNQYLNGQKTAQASAFQNMGLANSTMAAQAAGGSYENAGILTDKMLHEAQQTGFDAAKTGLGVMSEGIDQAKTGGSLLDVGGNQARVGQGFVDQSMNASKTGLGFVNEALDYNKAGGQLVGSGIDAYAKANQNFQGIIDDISKQESLGLQEGSLGDQEANTRLREGSLGVSLGELGLHNSEQNIQQEKMALGNFNGQQDAIGSSITNMAKGLGSIDTSKTGAALNSIWGGMKDWWNGPVDANNQLNHDTGMAGLNNTFGSDTQGSLSGPQDISLGTQFPKS